MVWKSPVGDVAYDLANLSGGTWGIDLDVSWSAVFGPRTLSVTATDDAGNKAALNRTITIGP
jgi:hypothetical protein